MSKTNTFSYLMETKDRLEKYDLKQSKVHKQEWYEIIDHQIRSFIFLSLFSIVFFFILYYTR